MTMENGSQSNSLDSRKTALVVIDLQNGVAGRPGAPHSGEQVVANAERLADAFTKAGAFVVLVRFSSFDGRDILRPRSDRELPAVRLPEGWDEYVPQLARFAGAYRLTKRQMGAFFGTDLDLQLRRRGIDTIVLCGVSTPIGVDTTAREAYQSGYRQIFAEDAMTADEKSDHDYVCSRIFPRMGRIRTTEEVLRMIASEPAASPDDAPSR